MPIPVHALAHRPLTVEAVTEFVALPAGPYISDDDDDALDAELRRRGWQWEDRLVCESFRTAHEHVLCSVDFSPFGTPDTRSFLVFGELYPVDPNDERMANESWLNAYVDAWHQLPGWSCARPSSDEDCEDVLAAAARSVTECLGSAPERTVPSSAAVAMGPTLTQRIWRTPTHALVLGPAADNGPYGYLTHLQLSCTPLSYGPDLPPADDGDGLAAWISAHIHG